MKKSEKRQSRHANRPCQDVVRHLNQARSDFNQKNYNECEQVFRVKKMKNKTKKHRCDGMRTKFSGIMQKNERIETREPDCVHDMCTKHAKWCNFCQKNSRLQHSHSRVLWSTTLQTNLVNQLIELKTFLHWQRCAILTNTCT